MRIANQTVYKSVISNLTKTSTEMFCANQVVSSGKLITKLSDDPVGLVAVLDLRASEAHIGQLERNIAMGKSWLNMGESALTQIEDLLSETKTLCVQMANATQNQSERSNAATLVEGYLEQIVSLANTQVGGRYIFGGTRTDTVPFVYNAEDDPPNVAYQGNDTPFSLKLGKDATIDVGRAGETIFGESAIDWDDPGAGGDNIFKTLLDLRDALNGNDIQGIEDGMESLDTHFDTIKTMIANTGSKILRLEVKENIIQDLELTYSERKSEIEDADLAEAVMDLSSKQMAYEAALASSSQVMQLSIVDYL